MQIPETVGHLIGELNSHGFEAYAVGGCVRDSLLGREPEDWDITTSARPESVKEIFSRTIDTGIQHGTVTVLVGKTGYEVTTYRIDGAYEDGRHPKTVAFTPNLSEDLKRRDFTINAMACGQDGEIVDLFGGQSDLKKRLIRCVGNPIDRFTEDALRILRAIRFSAQLDFAIEEETWKAISLIAPNLQKVSKERIQIELTKLLCSDYPERISQVFETGISSYISETFSRIAWEQVVMGGQLPCKKYLRWAAFLLVLGQTDACCVLKELKLDNDTISKVRVLTEWWDIPIPLQYPEIRRAMSAMEPEVWDACVELKIFLAGAKKCLGSSSCPSLPGGQSEQELKTVQSMGQKIRERGDCLSLKELAVGGRDLIAAGCKPGKELGARLEHLLELVLEHPEYNTKERLLQEI